MRGGQNVIGYDRALGEEIRVQKRGKCSRADSRGTSAEKLAAGQKQLLFAREIHDASVPFQLNAGAL